MSNVYEARYESQTVWKIACMLFSILFFNRVKCSHAFSELEHVESGFGTHQIENDDKTKKNTAIVITIAHVFI